jgi:hypothetical protein
MALILPAALDLVLVAADPTLIIAHQTLATAAAAVEVVELVVAVAVPALFQALPLLPTQRQTLPVVAKILLLHQTTVERPERAGEHSRLASSQEPRKPQPQRLMETPFLAALRRLASKCENKSCVNIYKWFMSIIYRCRQVPTSVFVFCSTPPIGAPWDRISSARYGGWIPLEAFEPKTAWHRPWAWDVVVS